MRAAIAIDDWKLATFKRELTLAGYQFEELPGLTPDTLTLIVETDDLPRLRDTVQHCQNKAAEEIN